MAPTPRSLAVPLGAEEFGREPRGEIEVGHERPHPGWSGRDVDLDDRARSVIEAQLGARAAFGRRAEPVEVGD